MKDNSKIITPCLMCNLLLNETRFVISDNATQQEVIQILDLYCFAFGPLYSKCKEIVNENAVKIFQALQDKIVKFFINYYV